MSTPDPATAPDTATGQQMLGAALSAYLDAQLDALARPEKSPAGPRERWIADWLAHRGYHVVRTAPPVDTSVRDQLAAIATQALNTAGRTNAAARFAGVAARYGGNLPGASVGELMPAVIDALAAHPDLLAALTSGAHQ